MILGVTVQGFGLSILRSINLGLGSSPYDAMPFIIFNRTKKLSFRVVRMLWDIAFMTAGFALGGSVGIVTVAVAFFCGPIVAWMQKKLTECIGIIG